VKAFIAEAYFTAPTFLSFLPSEEGGGIEGTALVEGA